MKYALFALALPVLSCGAAFAETRKEVPIPVDLTTDAQVAAYTGALFSAVDTVCRRVASPLIGTDYDVYRACRKATLVETAAKDPTGLLAARLGITSRASAMTVAAR